VDDIEQDQRPADHVRRHTRSNAPLRRPYDAPVIIVGALRSGTTMLRLMMDHHPELCVFAEFEELTRYLDGPGFPTVAEYKRRLATDRHARLKALHVDDGDDYVGVVRSFVRQSYGRWGKGKRVFGFTVHGQADRLPELFPDARFVHIVRDPRDVARSCIGMGWVGTVYHGADYWTRAENYWTRLRRDVPAEQRHELRYEELVRYPEDVLAELCGFLGVSFHPAMLGYGADTTYESPDAALAQQWRTKLSVREIELVEAKCGELMELRGYDRVRPHAPPGLVERVRLAVENRAGRVRFNLDRFGMPLYLTWITSRRLPFDAWKASVQLRINEIENAHVR
jgi:hypothetical protein